MWSQQLYTEGRYEPDFQGQVELIVQEWDDISGWWEMVVKVQQQTSVSENKCGKY